MIDGPYRAEWRLMQSAKQHLRVLMDGTRQSNAATRKALILDLQKLIWLIEHKPLGA